MLGDSNELDLLSIAPSMAVGGSMHIYTRVNKVANFKISRPSRSFAVIRTMITEVIEIIEHHMPIFHSLCRRRSKL